MLKCRFERKRAVRSAYLFSPTTRRDESSHARRVVAESVEESIERNVEVSFDESNERSRMNRLARRFVRDYDIRINAHYVGIGVSRCAVWYHYRSVDVIICVELRLFV